MKIPLPTVAAALVLAISAPTVHAQADIKAELTAIVGKIREKAKAGKRAESDLAPEIKEIDDLLAKYKDQKTDAVAEIMMTKVMIFAQLLQDTDRAVTQLQELKSQFPETTMAKRADDMLTSLVAQAEAAKVQRALVAGAVFPDFNETSLDGKPLSLAQFKGKVVLIDFWATWCGPCVAELPNVLKTYAKYHDKGLEVIGISLDSDKARLESFLKEKSMPWPQFFDGQGWKNALAAKYGINSIPMTYLLDKEGKIIAKSLRGAALEAAVEKALAGS